MTSFGKYSPPNNSFVFTKGRFRGAEIIFRRFICDFIVFVRHKGCHFGAVTNAMEAAKKPEVSAFGLCPRRANSTMTQTKILFVVKTARTFLINT